MGEGGTGEVRAWRWDMEDCKNEGLAFVLSGLRIQRAFESEKTRWTGERERAGRPKGVHAYAWVNVNLSKVCTNDHDISYRPICFLLTH